MNRILTIMLIFSLLAVSSVPLSSAGRDAQEANYCPLCHMNTMHMTHMHHTRQTMKPAMQHARIEYCEHHDIDTLPHLLAPHVVSLAYFDAYLIITDARDASVSTLKPRFLPYPTPPPKTS